MFHLRSVLAKEVQHVLNATIIKCALILNDTIYKEYCSKRGKAEKKEEEKFIELEKFKNKIIHFN